MTEKEKTKMKTVLNPKTISEAKEQIFYFEALRDALYQNLLRINPAYAGAIWEVTYGQWREAVRAKIQAEEYEKMLRSAYR